MDPQQTAPATARAKTVFFIWKLMPRLVLLTMLILIVVMAMAIVKKQNSIAADKAQAVSTEPPPVNTVVYPLSPTSIRDRLNLPGSIEPWTELELMAKVGGSVTEVLVEEGDEVKEGDILARIDDNDYTIAVQRAEAAYKLAKADYQRDKAIFSKGVIPEAQLDAKETAMLTAKADLDNARLLLSRTTIEAPISGVVRRLDAKVGLLLAVGDPIGQLLRIDKVKAVIGIPESDVTAVRRLDEVNVTLQALDNQVIAGRIHFLSPSPDSTARLYKLELELDNPSRAILPGMFVRGDVIKRTVDDVITVPFYSVISRNDEQYVFVEEQGQARKKIVELGIMEKWMVEVKKGLQTGERLVIEGHRDIEDGQKIEVVKVVNSVDEYTL
ncbi:MAG TPA: efflux RND transporter periplasmic adaptor subunit [Desulfopila sp.]|nr:efflux RND transporter periplasmic adaptor subunit [Desulfopila sp.]